MKIDEILALSDFKKAVEILTTDTAERDREAYRSEYDGDRNRRATGVGKREDKMVDVYSETERITDKDGNETPKKLGSNPMPVARVVTNIPKRIVRIAAAFLFGGEMSITFAEDSDASQHFKEVFDEKLKMKSIFNQLARIVKVETKGALIFYPRPTVDDEGKAALEVKVKVLSLKDGDFFPHFDEYGDMDAFTRTYKAMHIDGEERDFVWIQTASQELKYVDIDGDWKSVVGFPLKNLAGKITVVYAEQDRPDIEDVAVLLDYYENRLSKIVDTNDYFGDPILKNFGQSSLPSKNTVGKQISYPMTIDEETGKPMHGDAEYLVWQQSIDSIKLELETMNSEIYTGSSTPDFGFEKMKSIGALSGTAMELMFIEADIKAAEGMEIFGPVVQRSVSVVNALISNVTKTEYKEALKKAKPKVEFGSVLPDDLETIIEVLTKANGNKPINSMQTIIGRSPFTKNSEEEWKLLQDEADEENKRNQLHGIEY